MKTRSAAANAVLAAAVTVLLAVAACGGPRSGLGTHASGCFRALPAAADAVHDEGRLLGVRIVSDRHAREFVPYEAGTGDDHPVCLVAYRGQFGTHPVDRVLARSGDTFAVVAVALDAHPHALGAVVVDKLPTRFRHL